MLRYLESMSKDKGRSLSKLDLEGLAEYLKFLTSFSYPTEVGGKSQHAVLADGRITFFEQPIPNRPSPRRSPFFLHDDHLVFAGSTSHPGAMGIFVSRGRGELITNSKLSYIRQPLDNIVFVETTFDHCTLTYDGSPVTLFDSTNVVIDSTLVLGPQVDEFDPIVSRMKSSVPQPTYFSQSNSDTETLISRSEK